MKECILILGSNMGDKIYNIQKALKYIDNEIGKVIKQTEILETEPVEFVSCNIFCNIAILISTQHSPIALLNSIKQIEKKMGRIVDSKKSGSYEDRIIDIDIVSFENLFFKSINLDIPHFKHLKKRCFSKILIEKLKKQLKS